MDSGSLREVCVILPTLNERHNLEKLLPRLLKYDVIVVDDGSEDGTHELCEEFNNVQVIERGRKLGLVSAVMDGFKRTVEDYNHMVVMDADLSHNPNCIEEMIAMAISSKSDMVIGSRYVKGGISHDLSKRKIISTCANLIFKIAFSRKVKDATSGYRIYSKNAARFILNSTIEEPIRGSYAGQVDIMRRLLASGYKVSEFPISFTPRKSGKSKLSIADMRDFAMLAAVKGHIKRYFGVAALGLILNQGVLAFPLHHYPSQYAGALFASFLLLGLSISRSASTNNAPKVSGPIKRINRIYNNYAGPAAIAVLSNIVLFVLLVRIGLIYPIADIVGIISSIAISYGLMP